MHKADNKHQPCFVCCAPHRGMYVLQSLDASLQPLFQGVTQPPASQEAADVTAAVAAGGGVLSALPAGLVQLPTAQLLTELAGTVRQEVSYNYITRSCHVVSCAYLVA